MDSSYKALMKEVSQALRLDNENKFKEAYIKYLTCVLRIVTKLLKEGDSVADVPQYIKLGQQCFDRIMTFMDSSQQKVIASISMKVPSSQRLGTTQRLAVKSHDLGSLSSCPSQHVQTSRNQSISSRELAPTAKKPLTRLKRLTPVELAYKHNQQLMAAYKGRLERTAGKFTMAANLRLTLHRKMAENLAIAQAQEDALAKKMKERQQRLEEQAAKRFNTPIGMSKEEQEQRQIYKKILEYEQDTKGFAEMRKRIEENPNDSIIIQQLFKMIFSHSDHPLTQKLKQYQYKIYEKSFSLVAKKLEKLEKIRVPLPEDMHPCRKKDGDCSSDAVNNDEKESGPFSLSGSESNVNIRNESVDVPIEDENKEENISDDIPENYLTIEDNSKEEVKSETQPDSDMEEKIEHESTLSSQLSVEVFNAVEENPKDTDSMEVKDGNESPSEKSDFDSLKFNQSGSNSTVDSRDLCKYSNEEDDKSEHHDILENVTDDIKFDIRTALKENETCQEKLKDEMKKIKRISLEVARDCEKYNEENMDDLFDDDVDVNDNDDVDDNDEMQQKNSLSYHHIPKTCDKKTTVNTPSESDCDSDEINQSDPRDRTKKNIRDSADDGKINSLHRRKSNGNISDIDAQKIGAMRNEAYHRHLKGISEDVHTYMEKLQVLFTIAYEELNSPEGRDECYAALEEVFFKPVWQYLLALFRLTNEPKEIAAAYIMTVKSHSLPQDFGVVEKLCLVSLDDSMEDYPYRAAVDELCRLTEQSTLLNKLECIVKVSRLVCQCVDEYYQEVDSQETRKRAPSIGADDLLPILTYVIIQSRLPQIVSECHMMEEFIHEGYIMGEEGYCLTSMQTALCYVVSLGTTD